MDETAVVTRTWVRVLATLLLVVPLAGSVPLAIENMRVRSLDLGFILVVLACSVVGYLILTRTDGNRVGWVLGVISMMLVVAGAMVQHGGQSALASAVGSFTWFGSFVAFGFLIYWFPTGLAPSRGLRWVGWLGALAALVPIFELFAEEVCMEQSDDGCLEFARNPIGIPGLPGVEAELPVLFLAAIAFLILSVVSIVVRFVRARGVERLQLKWLTLAAVVALGGLMIGDIVDLPAPVSDSMTSILILTLPLAIGASILQYRLYDIDRLISRTVSYALVVALLGAIFFGLVTSLSSRVGADNQLVVAAATLVVAALFNPLRKRVQGLVDRRFNRSRYDTQKVMDGFASSLREQTDPETVIDGWVGVVSETMEPSSVGVWVRE